MQRFLANRKARGSEEERSGGTIETVSRKDVIFHKRIYGSVEALEGEGKAEERNRRFRIESWTEKSVRMKICKYFHTNLLFIT